MADDTRRHRDTAERPSAAGQIEISIHFLGFHRSVPQVRAGAVDGVDRCLLRQRPGRIILGQNADRATNRQRWRTRMELANAIVEYLELFRNRRRRHSALGMRTPIEYEMMQPSIQRLAWSPVPRLHATGGTSIRARRHPKGNSHLFKHLLTIAGLTGTVCALALPTGTAAAEPFPPGVTCSGTTCRNDTDEHYLVESWQKCRVVGGTSTTRIPFNVMMKPHETVQVTGVQCRPLIHEGYDDPDDTFPSYRTQIPQEPVGIVYTRAVTYDPNAKPPTGSAF
ncbi:IS3 family transposase [Nocardia sp. NBC_00416]|uniref:IS3 family transposase n=1 Tax=Nocardia sp. NBC_00416 TaxID=2975991 RepID=UPI003FA56739